MDPVTVISGNGRRKTKITRRSLAIVGSHPDTRQNAPYDDPSFEIWLFNEAPQKPKIYRRWDACLQLHRPEVYTSLNNWVNKDHWNWLQQDHGKPIYMIDVDPRVPNSVKYPLDQVLQLVPYRYLRSSPALALALAIYLGYTHIQLYGSDLKSDTEYSYQAINYAFWIGFAHGRGINLDLRCWQSEFNQPIYGFEGEAQLQKLFFVQRYSEYETAWKSNEKVLADAKERINQAMLENKFDKVGEISRELDLAAAAAGECSGVMREAKRYSEREDPISRQEFERVAAQAQLDYDEKRQEMWHAGGKLEYVWNAWRQTGRMDALNQFREFLKEKIKFAYDTGIQQGIFRENILYKNEYDKLITALGGQRAIYQVQE